MDVGIDQSLLVQGLFPPNKCVKYVMQVPDSLQHLQYADDTTVLNDTDRQGLQMQVPTR